MRFDPQTKPPRLAIIALSGAVLLASMAVSITAIALPALSRAMDAPVAAVQWVVLIYLLSVTITIVLAGRCADLFGHRFILLSGLTIFTGSSLLCAIAPNLTTLIIARAIQGIGGAVLMALPVSILRGMVSGERTGSAMGLLASMSAIGTALGPALGGLLIAGFGWRSAFILLTVCGFILLALAIRAIPASEQTQKTRHGLDLSGAFLLAVVLLLYALMASGQQSTIGLGLSITIPAALVALVFFIIVEVKSPSPLVPLSVLRNPAISASLLTNWLISSVMMAMLVVGPLFLSFGLLLGEAQTGLVVAVGPVVAALAGVPAGRLTDRFGTKRILTTGLGVMSIALISMAYLPVQIGITGYIVSLIMLTPCFQLFLAGNNTAIMNAAPEDQRGIISSLMGLSRNLGFMTGASVMATIFISALGQEDLLHATVNSVGSAFTITLLTAAGLAFTSLIISLFSLKE
ncbi:MFS transporter [Pseudochrobactrum kiredjianiae]|uniref:MFS transporter n=1 Tax=Pseudochrobactrum kiredjianiae TaxID=386305 RepID=A0ABW3UZJ2_9HYPH|nr:MFS transporter [Pseudochrobactrum kiredjianiae]MDM7851993.1 MFS transporter [Pseudochrobactrum kiredjianiae]